MLYSNKEIINKIHTLPAITYSTIQKEHAKMYEANVDTIINFSNRNKDKLRKYKYFLNRILAEYTINNDKAKTFIKLLNFWINASTKRYWVITRPIRLELAIHLLTYLDKIAWPLDSDNIDQCKLLLTKALHIKTINNKYYTSRSGISSK